MLDSLIQLDTEDDFLSFKLADKFVNKYAHEESPFGWVDAGGNSVGELIMIDKYSRLKEDGTKERWHEVCRRVIEGMYSIQKDWAKTNGLPWNGNKANASAEEAYDLLFKLYWTPPGRGLSSMGSYVVSGLKNSTPLQNCAYVSTADMTKADPTHPFTFLMDVSMLGVGVGYDTKGADKGFVIHEPDHGLEPDEFLVPDSREGWVEALKLKLESYLLSGRRPIEINTRLIRPKGSLIKTFGGVAPGPEPLERLMVKIDQVLGGRDGETLTVKDIVDIANLIGICVVSGNVRRSAEIALGMYGDKVFTNLKNYEVYPERQEWGWMSNNSVFATPGQNYDDVIEGIQLNGEPGVLWMDNVHGFGRTGDGRKDDYRAAGVNPCAEQFLESGEMCTLADLHFSRIPNALKLRRAVKYAFLYAKTVTLLPTHLQKTNAIMQRNRRIGLSVSGVADFMDNRGRNMLRAWLDTGYNFVREYDRIYSEWLCVRESIRVTTVKPTGTIGILVGESPGGHWTVGGSQFLRAVTYDKDNPFVQELKAKGYRVEESVYNPETSVVAYFPISTDAKRTERDVTLFEKAALAADLQRYWSDNGVSVTLSFHKEEAQHISTILTMYDSQLKAVSFLPMTEGVYQQAPFAPIGEDEFTVWGGKLGKLNYDLLYNSGRDAEGERGCVSDVCIIKSGE